MEATNPLRAVWQFLKFWFWDKWHGVSISAFDERRATITETPVFEIGSFRLPKWILYVILGLIILALLLMFVFKVRLTNNTGLQEQPGLVSQAGCFAKDASGRLFVAVDCVWKQYLLGATRLFLWPIVPVILVFAAGFVSGVQYQKRREGG